MEHSWCAVFPRCSSFACSYQLRIIITISACSILFPPVHSWFHEPCRLFRSLPAHSHQAFSTNITVHDYVYMEQRRWWQGKLLFCVRMCVKKYKAFGVCGHFFLCPGFTRVLPRNKRELAPVNGYHLLNPLCVSTTRTSVVEMVSWSPSSLVHFYLHRKKSTWSWQKIAWKSWSKVCPANACHACPSKKNYVNRQVKINKQNAFTKRCNV